MTEVTPCPKCGAPTALGKFCSQCGASAIKKTSSPFLIGFFGALGLCVFVLMVISIRSKPNSATTQGPVQGNPVRQEESASGPLGIGETAMIRKGDGFWPCASSEAAFDELAKYYGDNAELKRTIARTRSVGVNGGMRVKVLDSAFARRKIRVLTNDAGESWLKDEKGSFLADSRIGRECWIAPEALTRP